jgi:hypothetical protein
LTLLDAAARSVVLARLAGDALGLADAADADSGQQPTAGGADSFSLSDAAARSQALLRAVGDSLVIADAAGRALDLLRSGGDALTLTDAVVRAAGRARLIGDSLTLEDLIEESGVGQPREVGDFFVLVDSAFAIAWIGQRGVPGQASVGPVVGVALGRVGMGKADPRGRILLGTALPTRPQR